MMFFQNTKEFVLFVIAVTLAVIFSIITMQIMVGIIIIAIAFLGVPGLRYLRNRNIYADAEPGEGEAVLAAGLITLVALANMQWVVWAVGLAFIFMIHQSLARIEKRMDELENSKTAQE